RRLEMSNAAKLRKLDLLPVFRNQSEREGVFGDIDESRHHVLMTEAGVFRRVAVASERRAEVEQVMANETAAVFLDNGVQRVSRLCIGVVQPCRKDVQPAKVATIFVRCDVVGIVGASAVIAERSDTFAFQRETGDDAI